MSDCRALQFLVGFVLLVDQILLCPLAGHAEPPGRYGGHAIQHGAAAGQKGTTQTPVRGIPDQDVAHDAVQRGLITPLHQVLSMVTKAVPGRVLSVQLDHIDNSEWLYHFRVIAVDGRCETVTVDAVTNIIVDRKQ